MSYTIHSIKEFPRELLPQLATLHLDDHGLLTQLGYPFVLRYFEIVLEDKDVVGVFAQDDQSGKLVGYNVASPKPDSLTSQLTKNRAWFVKEIIKVIFTKPSAFIQLLISSLTIKTQMEDEEGAIESLYLTINDEYRGQKVGRTLQQGLFEEARKAGYKRIVGSIETWNEASIKMCQSNGFVIKKTFREGKFIRHRIEKIL
ncbi:MAG: GNAT family N-acetyltransferase [Anaerolineales bacterium]